VSKKRDRRLLPPIPEPLPVPVLDNHTHLAPDPDHGTQNVDDDGGYRAPLLLENQVSAMAAAGIAGAITVGCEIPDLQPSIDIANAHRNIWAALAIHPNEAPLHAGIRAIGPDGLEPRVLSHHDLSLDDAVATVADLVKSSDRVVAVGETGFDYFRTATDGVDAQKAAFRAHIALAKEVDLPLQIHDRDAHADVVEILRADAAPQRTVFHCFSGDRELAEVCAAEGWYASFAGPLTYPANDDLREAFLAMPAELILVETDAPYLTAAPYRGQPNAPFAAAYTVRAMAELRSADLTAWCEQLASNTERVYGLRGA